MKRNLLSASKIFDLILEHDHGKVTKDTFRETMGERYSYRETFALWIGNTQVSGTDHSGEFRIGGRGQINCNTLSGIGHVCKSASMVQGIYITNIQSIGLAVVSDIVAPLGRKV